MTSFSLLLRNLRYFRWSNLAVGTGVIVATAVLTGAMMVGDSVRESLRALAVQRLGPVDQAMVGPRFFLESLADRMGKSPEFGTWFDQIHAGIIVRGGARAESEAERTAGVQIAAIEGPWAKVGPGMSIINGELASSLPSVKVGGKVIFSLPKLEDGPRDATLAKRGRGDVADETEPKQVASIAAERGFESMFSLSGGQRTPRNAWLNLADLQEVVGQAGRVNMLLVHDKGNATAQEQATAIKSNSLIMLSRILRDVVKIEDYGLSLATSDASGQAVLSSSDTYLMPALAEAAERAAKEVGAPAIRVSSYLINTAVNVSGGKEIHYAMIAGISSLDDKPLAADEIALNQWVADRLGAKLGDSIRLDYYHRNMNGELAEVASDRPGVGMKFRVARILPMAGLGADPTLTPIYKGLTDSDAISSWKEPAGMPKFKKEWITKDDEAYWKDHKAAPKLFVSLEAAKKLWGGSYGDVTSVRVPAAKRKAFEEELRRQIDPTAVGMVFRAVRAEQLAAAGGSTDFAELFISFSFFLIAAAVLLVAMLFRLNIEQRARQLGLLAAIGFTPKALRRMALKEGMIVAVIGAAFGLAGAVGYTALMMVGLRTWWVGAVGTTAMNLHVVPMTLVYGFVTSLMIAALAILWGVWRVGRTPAGRLLAGGWGTATPATKTRGKWTTKIGLASLLLAIMMLACGLAKIMSPQEAFLGGGTLLLIAGLILLAGRLQPRRGGGVTHSLSGLGFRNASRHTARSALTMGLIAFATFALVTVAAMRGGVPEETGDKGSGAGGYRLMLRADIPLTGDLNTDKGRDVLAVTNADDAIWSRLHFTPMRRWAGEDISCLNLTKPGSPTILSVPLGMVERRAFKFAQRVKKTANPWTLLGDSDLSKDEIPVIADENTAQYILHLGLGQSIEVTDQAGARRKLVLVATLAGSVFQGELLMGEANFVSLFPAQSGAGVVMIDADAEDVAGAQKMLSGQLGDFSVTVDRTADVLAMYKNVENTYMATFQVLGSLGLLLGTVGLAVVLLRGLVERKAELAMLAAIGFRRLDRLRMVLAENVLLLLLGLGVGTACAIIAMLPALMQSGRRVDWVQLLLTLAGVLAAGFVSLVLAVWFGGRRVEPGDLRSE